jgi:hypothetical protein
MAASGSPSSVAKKKRPGSAAYIARIESCRYSRDLRMTKLLRSAVPAAEKDPDGPPTLAPLKLPPLVALQHGPTPGESSSRPNWLC